MNYARKEQIIVVVNTSRRCLRRPTRVRYKRTIAPKLQILQEKYRIRAIALAPNFYSKSRSPTLALRALSNFDKMSLTSSASPGWSTSRPLSCISGSGPNSPCGNDNWDRSPDSGFYTACCDGDLIDITGFNSWPGYTLLLKNLVCCHGESSDARGFKNETEGCINGAGTPLEQLLSTSTEVAQSWTMTSAGQTKTMEAECFWSQGNPSASTSSTKKAETSTMTSSDSFSWLSSDLFTVSLPEPTPLSTASQASTTTPEAPQSSTNAAGQCFDNIASLRIMLPVVLLATFFLQ